VNVARFVATWFVVGGATGAAIMISELDSVTAPSSPDEAATAPFAAIAFVVLSLFVSGVGLLLLAPVVVPGLAIYLGALWWTGRAVPSRWRRAAAVALSPLVAVLSLVGGDDAIVKVAMVLGSFAFGAVAKLPEEDARGRRARAPTAPRSSRTRD